MMKNPLPFIVIAALTAFVGIGAYITNRPQPAPDSMAGDTMSKDVMTYDPTSDAMMIDDTDTEGDTKMEAQPTAGDGMMATAKMMDSGNRYVEYADGVLENGASGKRVLFFYASWCPTCRPVDAELRANADRIPNGISVIRVNYNDPETDPQEEALANTYGITYQHTFVEIDGNGDAIQTWNGGGLDTLITKVN